MNVIVISETYQINLLKHKCNSTDVGIRPVSDDILALPWAHDGSYNVALC